MKKQMITESLHLEGEWYKQSKEQTIDTLPDFINHLMNDYHHDYGTLVKAMTACSLATLWATNKMEQGGITGFQASCLMWEFIRNWSYSNVKTGLRMIDYDNMLYPQYGHIFHRTITKEVFSKLQEEATKILLESKQMHPNVILHMQSIVDGNVPFGYTVSEE